MIKFKRKMFFTKKFKFKKNNSKISSSTRQYINIKDILLNNHFFYFKLILTIFG